MSHAADHRKRNEKLGHPRSYVRVMHKGTVGKIVKLMDSGYADSLAGVVRRAVASVFVQHFRGTADRNEVICMLHAKGMNPREIASLFALTRQRIHQIVGPRQVGAELPMTPLEELALEGLRKGTLKP